MSLLMMEKVSTSVKYFLNTKYQVTILTLEESETVACYRGQEKIGEQSKLVKETSSKMKIWNANKK